MSAISFGYCVSRGKGPHSQVLVYAGREPGSRGYCGTLTMRHEEAEALVDLLQTTQRREVEAVEADLADGS
ncbi:MAG: hypothetical protein ACRDNS_14245 [Trebonia sp.]